MYVDIHKRALYGICRANKFSHSMALDFIGHLRHLEIHHGIKFVVGVLKDRAGALVKRDYKTFRTSEGLWVGPWRNFHRMARRSRRQLRLALRVLKCVGLFVHKPPTLSDYVSKKFDLLGSDSVRMTFTADALADHTRTLYYPRRYSTQYPLSTKRAPIKIGINQAEVLTSPREHIDSLEMFPHFVVEFYQELSSLVGNCMPPYSYYYDLSRMRAFDVAGSVSLLTKDRGMKLRLIANCNRMLQLCVSPLHNFLMKIMQTVPECFVFDQDRGADWVVRQLRQGKHMTSLDLKSASDNIPLGSQLALISQIAPEYSVELAMFHRIARMSWSTPHEFFIRWETGHPMGVNASFALFTTWLINLFYLVGAEGAFCIVGDDLVFDSIYESEIIARLELYGVPINRGKSLFSDDEFSEFVGRILDKYGSLGVFKAAPFRSHDPLGIIRQFGYPSIKHLGPKRLFGKSYKDVVDCFLYLQTSPVLKAALLELSTPYERLSAEYHVPLPIYSGGVSQTILRKMYQEVPDAPISESDKLQIRLASEYGETSPWLASEESLRQVRRETDIKHLLSMPPGRAYDSLSRKVCVVQAFTVAENDSVWVSFHQALIASLKLCKTDDEALDLLISYQDRLDLFNINPVFARNIAVEEERAIKSMSRSESKRGNQKFSRSYVRNVYFWLERTAKRYLRMTK